MKAIVDTNIVFSALLSSENIYRNELLFNEDVQFYTCRFLIVEVFKNKEKMVKLSKFPEEELLEVFYDILKNFELYNEDLINKDKWKEAYELCKDIDLKDTPFVALCLEMDARMWTGDEVLKKGLIKKEFKKFFSLKKSN